MGDTHWRKDYGLDEGEELELERGGIMVEIGECIGKREQDLTELVDKRVKDREERAAAKIASTPMRPQASFNPQTPAGSSLLRPKSLNAVLGNPTGHYGKAVLPNWSPFEQRQQANCDENGSERPAKRRKQNDTPPSKNGYAQSLMGTKLSLTSSRPPSTASVRYEPFKPSIQRPLAATIDLTVDDEPRSLDTSMQESTKTKPPRRQPHKAPLARNGYASNLTGASLSLDRPETFASKRSNVCLGLSTKGNRQTEDTGSSSPGESSQLMDDGTSDALHGRRNAEQMKPVRKKSKMSLPAPPAVSRASSPPISRRQPSMSHSTITENRTYASSVIRCADQSGSTLRIKSRPRKMMMLMDCPISRSPALTESSNDTRSLPRTLQTPNPAPQEVALSQATLRLDAFRAQQEQRMQDRLSGKRPNTEVEDLPSSPAHSGTDHRIIENLLSRKMKQPKRTEQEFIVETQARSATLERSRKDNGIAQVGQPKQPMAVLNADLISNVETLDPIQQPPNPISLPKLTVPSRDSTRGTGALQGKPQTSSQLQRSPSPRELPKSTISNSDAPSSIAASPHRLSQTRERHSLETALQSTIPSTDATGSVVEPLSEHLKSPQQPKSHSPNPLRRSTIPSTDAASGIVAPSPKGLAAEKSLKSSIARACDKSIPEVMHLGPHVPVNQTQDYLEVGGEEEIPILQDPGSPEIAEALHEHPENQISRPQNQASIANTISAATDGSEPTMDRAASTIIETMPTVSEVKTSIPRNLDDGKKAPSLPAHVSGATISATAHFHSMIKTSSSPSNQAMQQFPNLEPCVQPPTPELDDEKHEPMSSDFVIKASMNLSPPMGQGLGSEVQGANAIKSATRIEDASVRAIPLVLNARMPAPNLKIVNPATRGPSVQMTANRTVNAIGPVLNALPSIPPLARSLNRLGRNLVQTDNRVGAPVKEPTPGGPWSRESFDLFGTWRPSGRDGGTGSVGG